MDGVDLVNHPPHYKGNKYESIDVIEDFGLGFNLGNAVKYILRCQRKGTKVQDMEKAIWYLKREISTASDSLVYTSNHYAKQSTSVRSNCQNQNGSMSQESNITGCSNV